MSPRAKSISAKAVAVAVVALAKVLMSRDPAMADQLNSVLQSASTSGIPTADLDLLRLLVQIGKP